jgi:hypothetical protein
MTKFVKGSDEDWNIRRSHESHQEKLVEGGRIYRGGFSRERQR